MKKIAISIYSNDKLKVFYNDVETTAGEYFAVLTPEILIKDILPQLTVQDETGKVHSLHNSYYLHGNIYRCSDIDYNRIDSKLLHFRYFIGEEYGISPECEIVFAVTTN